jgi:hypothetical protein
MKQIIKNRELPLTKPQGVITLVRTLPKDANKVTMCNGPTKALVCNKTLIHMSHIKTLKITPTCFDRQLIIIRELLITG